MRRLHRLKITGSVSGVGRVRNALTRIFGDNAQVVSDKKIRTVIDKDEGIERQDRVMTVAIKAEGIDSKTGATALAHTLNRAHTSKVEAII